jgi:hypothetical protein
VANQSHISIQIRISNLEHWVKRVEGKGCRVDGIKGAWGGSLEDTEILESNGSKFRMNNQTLMSFLGCS